MRQQEKNLLRKKYLFEISRSSLVLLLRISKFSNISTKVSRNQCKFGHLDTLFAVTRIIFSTAFFQARLHPGRLYFVPKLKAVLYLSFLLNFRTFVSVSCEQSYPCAKKGHKCSSL